VAKATFHSLTAWEQALVAATERDHMRSLGEDALLDLHARVRRARDKYVSLHRREVGEQVRAEGARGAVSAAPRRSQSKAEVFEGALARVSASLAVAARQSAAALRAERIGSARATSGARRSATASSGKPRDNRAAKSVTRARARPPVERKTAASTRAAGARRQAKRDAR
jgi:hypothetical protein